MITRKIVVFVLSCISIGIVQAQAPGTLLKEKPYHFPYENYDAFSTHLKKLTRYYTPWTDASIKAVFPRELYDNCSLQKDMKMSEVLYQGKSGIVRGWTIQPKNTQKKLPVLVFNRGGFAKWGRIVPIELAMLCRISSQGYIVVASDFRGEKEGEPGQDKTDLGYGDVHDSFDLVKAIGKAYPNADTDNLAVWGFSRGTTITAMMATLSDKIRVVILQGMVTNSVENDRRAEFDEHVYPLLVDGYAKLPKAEQDKLLAGISPINLIDKIKGKPAFMILHGSHDKRTSASAAMQYAGKLLTRKYPVEMHLYENSGHVIVGNYHELVLEVTDWLERYMTKK